MELGLGNKWTLIQDENMHKFVYSYVQFHKLSVHQKVEFTKSSLHSGILSVQDKQSTEWSVTTEAQSSLNAQEH